MAAKRHRLAQRRKTVGFTQEGLAQQLGVDPTTVRRWESGETEGGPQPWVRPKLAHYLQVSAEQLDELFREDTDAPASREPLLDSVSPQSSNEPLTELLNLGAQPEVFLPAIVNGRLAFIAVDGETITTNWDVMSPSTRRSVLGYGFATAVASVLGVNDVAQALHQSAVPLTLSAPAHTSWAKATYKAVLNPMGAARRATAAASESAEDLRALRVAVDRGMQVSLSSDYGALEQSLPSLIGCVEAAIMQPQEDEGAVSLALSDVYAVAGWMLIKADSPVGAWLAAQRAIQAAEQVGDVLRLAAATRCLAEVHMRAHNFEEATRTAFLAAVQAEGALLEDQLVATSLRGAALLSAAASSARRGDSGEARSALTAAARCAVELGQDRADLATVFGPTNVAIHQVAIAIELGDAQGALRHISAVQLDRMPKPLTERRARFLIDVARSYAQVKDDVAAIDALLQAETIAPDELRHHRLTHALVPQLLARERRTSELRALASRCNLLN
ncbi:MAG: helix-turn-helix transcriptional regulator [Actinobacteria bacterium]|nr:helix-turn-helix transcriptional regulator [Actinomycetota bacterium]